MSVRDKVAINNLSSCGVYDVCAMRSTHRPCDGEERIGLHCHRVSQPKMRRERFQHDDDGVKNPLFVCDMFAVVPSNTLWYKIHLMATKLGTAFIGYASTENVLHAVRYANDNGRPLNLIATIDLAGMGISNDNAGPIFRNVWCNLARWWRYQGSKGREIGSFDGVATHENPADKRNVHWLIHAPAAFRSEVEEAIAKRLRKLVKLDCLGDALHFQNADAPGTLAKYMLKGVNPVFAKILHIDASNQGPIIGRRVTVSRSLGQAARCRQKWVRKRRPRSSYQN